MIKTFTPDPFIARRSAAQLCKTTSSVKASDARLLSRSPCRPCRPSATLKLTRNRLKARAGTNAQA